MNQPTNFKLYHYWRSSCSWRVRWAMAIKKIGYESIPVNLLEKQHLSDAYRQQNPSGFVPCLEFKGKVVGESLAIIEFLEETYPQPALLPEDPWSKTVVRQLAYTIACGTQPLQNLGAQQFFSDVPSERERYTQHWIRKGLATYEEILVKHPKSTFSFGDSVTLADLCLVPQVYNALRFKVDLAPFPLIDAIYRRCIALPECDQAAPHNQPGASGMA